MVSVFRDLRYTWRGGILGEESREKLMQKKELFSCFGGKETGEEG